MFFYSFLEIQSKYASHLREHIQVSACGKESECFKNKMIRLTVYVMELDVIISGTVDQYKD